MKEGEVLINLLCLIKDGTSYSAYSTELNKSVDDTLMSLSSNFNSSNQIRVCLFVVGLVAFIGISNILIII